MSAMRRRGRRRAAVPDDAGGPAPTVRPVALFFVSTPDGFGLYIFLLLIPFIVLCPLYYYYQHHPVNLLLLGLFTIAYQLRRGALTCAFTKGEVILESAEVPARPPARMRSVGEGARAPRGRRSSPAERRQDGPPGTGAEARGRRRLEEEDVQ